MTRQQDTLDALAAADQWAIDRGIPRNAGWYSGQWYVEGYLGGWMPPGRVRWWASYGVQAGSLLGGDIVAHQWTSTPIDQDVLADSEIIDYGDNGNGGSDDVLIPDDYVQKFHLTDNHDVQGLIDNFEGVITLVREQAEAEGADAEAKLAKIKEVVNAGSV